MKVALVHDWLTGMRGGEMCLEAFLCIYPKADVFTLVHLPGATSERIDARVKASSFLNRIPGIARLYRAFLPLYPAAASSLNLNGYDLVISLSHAAAKNVQVPAGVPHICYCFTPMRYIWDQAGSYFKGIVFLLAQPLLLYLRRWDLRGSKRITHFVAISSFIAARIRKFYGREAVVITPPVRMCNEVSRELSAEEKRFFEEHPEPFFLCAGALVPYKRIDVAVDAFKELGLPLWVLGGGPEEEKLRQRATSAPFVRFLGRVSEAFLWECYSRCRALVFPGIEDFGIVPVECMASGRPIIALDAGGLRESVGEERPVAQSELVLSNSCGVFITKRFYGDPSALAQAVRSFCKIEGSFSADLIRERARAFSYANFFKTWESFAQSVGIDSGDGMNARQTQGENMTPLGLQLKG